MQIYKINYNYISYFIDVSHTVGDFNVLKLKEKAHLLRFLSEFSEMFSLHVALILFHLKLLWFIHLTLTLYKSFALRLQLLSLHIWMVKQNFICVAQFAEFIVGPTMTYKQVL